MTHEQKPESNFTTMRVPSWPDLNPDPFVFVIAGRGRMSFYKDGRVVADFVEPDEAAKDFVKFIEDHYRGHILEAEARGAAEQRRKDAEGAEPVGYVLAGLKELFSNPADPLSAAMILASKDAPHIVPLYARPANVAALEARVKELEEENERLKKPEWVCDEETSYADVHDALSQRDDPILEITKFTACRSVRDIWAFLDEKFVVHEFATGIEAKNAAAALREGGEHG